MLPLYTLRTLQRHGFDKDLIDIFVIQDEYETYKQHLELNPYYKNLIVGVPGLSSQRQFIKDYYPLDKEIFFCDDDLNVFKLLPQGLSLPQIVSYMFLVMKAEGIHLGGFYPTNSLLFMNNAIRFTCSSVSSRFSFMHLSLSEFKAMTCSFFIISNSLSIRSLFSMVTLSCSVLLICSSSSKAVIRS